MSERTARFCPMCGTALERQDRYGRVRPACPACGHVVFFDPRVAVVVLVLRDDRVLLVKRAVDPGRGQWALPAGFVDAGEDPQEAAAREILEETNLRIRVDRLLDVFPKADDTGTADIVIAYSGSVLGGHLRADDDAEAAGWFTAAALPELVFRTTEVLIQRWIDHQL